MMQLHDDIEALPEIRRFRAASRLMRKRILVYLALMLTSVLVCDLALYWLNWESGYNPNTTYSAQEFMPYAPSPLVGAGVIHSNTIYREDDDGWVVLSREQLEHRTEYAPHGSQPDQNTEERSAAEASGGETPRR